MVHHVLLCLRDTHLIELLSNQAEVITCGATVPVDAQKPALLFICALRIQWHWSTWELRSPVTALAHGILQVRACL